MVTDTIFYKKIVSVTIFFLKQGSLLLVLSMGLFAALGVYYVRSNPVHLEPGTAPWRRLVTGATRGGVVHEQAAVFLTGLNRRSENRIRIRVAAAGSVVRISFDQGTIHPVRTDRNGEAEMEMPRANVPGARIDLFRSGEEPPVRIRELSVRQTTRPHLLSLACLAFLASLTSAILTKRKGKRLGLAVGCAAAALLTLFSIPALVFLSAPDSGSLLRLMIPIAWLGVSCLIIYTSRSDRRFYWRAVLLLTAFVFGWWVRWYFLPSAGSWDTEYWKAWMMRTVSHGVTQVYGDADAVPEGHFMAQLLGKENLWRVGYSGRNFVVDYPPLAMAVWRASWWTVSTLMPWWNYGEAQNVAVKLPSVLGDILAVFVLFAALRRRPLRGWTLGALYWALPVSWLSSAVLGFLDGAYVPFAVGALLFAGSGRAAHTGVLLALAALIKPQGLIVAPAAAVALWVGRGNLLKAVGVALGVVVIAILPFIAMGTLSEAVVHVFRILFQQRLSAGFGNPWWIVGHFADVAREGIEVLTQPVTFTLVGAVGFPARLMALALFTLATLWICDCHRRFQGAGTACLAGAAVFFSYSVFALGVHHNHPHLIFLALAATGLTSRRLQRLAGILTVSYVTNLLMLSGLGRFHGSRYLILEPWTHVVSDLRMALGFDLTLFIALANTILYAWLIVSLPRELSQTQLMERQGRAVDPCTVSG
jgi:hypothetical protein